VTGRFQKTIRNAIECTGIGLHSGARVDLTLHPASPDAGIRFRRIDVTDRDNEIPALWDAVADTRLNTTLANAAGVGVATVEHLMAALAGLGIDNLTIELDGPEVPVMDGSAAPFVFLLECAGLQEQAAPRRWLKVLKEVRVEEPGRSVSLAPADGFVVDFEIDFDSRAIACRQGRYELGDGAFKRDIARARTFGFERDVQRLWQMGLARGGSLDNAVVIGADDRILNEGGLRYRDEFVRHKVLDSVGDLYLAGAPILGHFRGVRSGHALNNKLLATLFATPGAWTWARENRPARPVPTPRALPQTAVAAPA